jgi:enamine deaminase RidA (YjgF/YER057c/UK114 family)
MIDVIDTGIVPSKGPVNGTVKAGNMLFMAHVPKDPVTGAIVAGDIEVQTRRALANLRMAVEAAGGSLADVAQLLIHLIDKDDAAGMNKVYREVMPTPYPSRATVVVKELLTPGMRIEILAWAVLA